jgi:membrane fusion protein (multidrug efflux system)
MTKKIVITLIGVVVLVGVLAGLKFSQFQAMAQTPFEMPPTVVTTAEAKELTFAPTIPAVGTIIAAQGVIVSTEVGGTVRRIAFESGSKVEAGDLLVELDYTTEEAQLRSAEASAELAELSLTRSRELRGTNTISQADLDAAEAQSKQAKAQVENLKAVIAKKTIRAPFAGRVGIRQINLGQFLNAGSPIVSLESVDPVYVDFSLPQRELSNIKDAMVTRVTSDAVGGRTFEGRLSAVNTVIDPATRNVRLRATLSNADGLLRSGMFVNVTLVEPKEKTALTVPATSILYAPFGDSVFVVEEKKDEASGQTAKVLRQQFIRLGSPLGDFATIQDGLKPGDVVVTSGVFKLRGGMPIQIDNKLAPEAKLNPTPDNS